MIMKITNYSGMWHCVIKWKVPNILNDYRASKTYGTTHLMAQCHVPEGLNLQQHRFKKVMSHVTEYVY
jgi:hypothetical protein